MRQAVKQNGLVLDEYASEDLKSDREIVLEVPLCLPYPIQVPCIANGYAPIGWC